MANEDDLSLDNWEKLSRSCQPIERFLVLKNPSNDASLVTGSSTVAPNALEKYDDCVYDSISLDQYLVPLSLVERWGSAMGILVLINSS